MEWISVKDRLPTMRIPVLVWSEVANHMMVCERAIDQEIDDWNWFFVGIPGCGGPIMVTHWMLLPAPPTSEDDK